MDNAIGPRKDFPETNFECEESARVTQLDGKDRLLRVNAGIDARERLAALHCIDLSVDSADITQIPSVCYGCGGG